MPSGPLAAKTAGKRGAGSAGAGRARSHKDPSVRVALGSGPSRGSRVVIIQVMALFLGFPFPTFLVGPLVFFPPFLGVVVIKLATTHVRYSLYLSGYISQWLGCNIDIAMH